MILSYIIQTKNSFVNLLTTILFFLEFYHFFDIIFTREG